LKDLKKYLSQELSEIKRALKMRFEWIHSN